MLTGNPFAPPPEDQFTTVQNYFAEYHLEVLLATLYNAFPSRPVHALLLFATKVDAGKFPHQKHPSRVFGKYPTGARSKGTYTVSFHDSGAGWTTCACRTA